MIQFRLDIARQYLKDAELLLGSNRGNSAISRAYYASYQAMWSALGSPEVGKIWRHLAIIKHFIRGYWLKPDYPRDGPGLFEDLRFPLRQLYVYRVAADYDGLSIEKRNIEQTINTVKETIQIIEKTGGEK